MFLLLKYGTVLRGNQFQNLSLVRYWYIFNLMLHINTYILYYYKLCAFMFHVCLHSFNIFLMLIKLYKWVFALMNSVVAIFFLQRNWVRITVGLKQTSSKVGKSIEIMFIHVFTTFPSAFITRAWNLLA